MIFISWPVRTLSFSHDSQMIASASEDLFIDIVTGINMYLYSYLSLSLSLPPTLSLSLPPSLSLSPYSLSLSPKAHVQTGQKVHQITTQAPTFTVSWHPKKHLLVYACDDKVITYQF